MLTRSAQTPTFMVVPSYSRFVVVAGLLALAQLPAQTPAPQAVGAFRLVVTPISLRVPIGGTAPLRVTAYDAKGSALPHDSYQVSFTLADSSVATVDSHGVVTGLKAG